MKTKLTKILTIVFAASMLLTGCNNSAESNNSIECIPDNCSITIESNDKYNMTDKLSNISNIFYTSFIMNLKMKAKMMPQL